MRQGVTSNKGLFRVLALEQRTSVHGTPFTKLTLGNAAETLIAFAWGDTRAKQSLHPKGAVVKCALQRRILNGNVVADLLDSSLYEPSPPESISLLPVNLFESHQAQERLQALLSKLSSGQLREFVERALMDFSFAQRFLREPASLNYHHASPGGLLDHSLDCAEFLASTPALDELHKDLAIVAALFHDAGKTGVFENQQRTRVGQLISHDALTLTVLKTPLNWLESEWPDAAYALMHIWTCKNDRRWGYHPLSPVAHLVQMADRWSAEWDKYRMAFKAEPDWKRFSRFNSKESYWRPLPLQRRLANESLGAAAHG